jgi:hypothetical protein
MDTVQQTSQKQIEKLSQSPLSGDEKQQEATNELENLDTIPTIFHFSCKNCNTHITDTTWFYESNQEMGAFEGHF